jgi:D-alanyl-D-alanine carboxypeptidase
MKHPSIGRLAGNPLWAMIAALLFACTATAQDEALRFAEAYGRLDEFIAAYTKQAGTPGMAVALTSRRGLLRVSAYGFADRKAKVPLTPQTLFEIGSISKSFTAIALLQQREQGRLDLRRPLTDYLPWFKIHSQYCPITVHDLLTHTAGLPADRDDIPSSLYTAVALRERSTGYAPGTRFYYSNIGFQVLGYLVEALYRRPYAEVIHEQILAPLGMDSSEAAITNSMRSRLAVGYIPFFDDRPTYRGEPLVEAPWLEYGAGDGSVAATASDLAAYLRMLLNRGQGPRGRVLSEESFRLLVQPWAKMDSDWFYGYGLAVRRAHGHTVFGHSGGMIGYTSRMEGDLDDGLGAVVFVNGPGNPNPVASFALDLLRAALHGETLPPLPEPGDPTHGDHLADYEGTYASPNGKQLQLLASGSQLLLVHGQERIVLEPRGKDAFYVSHPDFALFLLRFGRQDGHVAEATFGPDWFVNTRYVGPKVFHDPPDWETYTGHYRSEDHWFSNFRIVARQGKLWMIDSDGSETELKPAEPGYFQLGSEPTPERIRFDTPIGGKTLRAELSGKFFYRTFTP